MARRVRKKGTKAKATEEAKAAEEAKQEAKQEVRQVARAKATEDGERVYSEAEVSFEMGYRFGSGSRRNLSRGAYPRGRTEGAYPRTTRACVVFPPREIGGSKSGERERERERKRKRMMVYF